MKANVAHTEMLQQLCVQHPEATYLDTHPKLDGCTEMFIDLGHFTQPGRERLAENIFAGLRPVLEQELSLAPVSPH